MGIEKHNYKTYTCDICGEELRARSVYRHYGRSGEYPIIIGGVKLHLCGWLEPSVYRKPIVICSLCQKRIKENIIKEGET